MGDGVQLGNAYGVVEIDAAGVRQGLETAEQALSNFGRQMATIGATLTLGVTAPLVAVGKSALNTAMDFQSSMAMFDTVSGATAEQMEQVRQVAVALGADMTLPATSAGDAGNAMTELAKAGLSVKDSMEAARGTLQLAAAGQLAEAEAAMITANALNTFGLAGSEAGRVADLLAAAANASSASVGDLAAGLQQGGFAFKAAGLSLEELVTAVAALTNVGLTGADAGTALKNAILKLAAPTKEGAALMQQLGINVFDANGKMLPMPGVIDAFNQGLSGMTQQQRLAALSTIVLSDGAKALLPLLDLGAQGFTALQGQVTRQGAAAELAAAQMTGLRGAFAGFKSQLETVGLTIATQFLPVLEDIVRKLADLVASFLTVSPNVQNAVLAFLAVLAAAGPVIAALGVMATALGFLLSPIGLLVAGTAALAAAWAGDFMGIASTVSPIVEAMAKVFQMWYAETGNVTSALLGMLGGLGLMVPALQPVIETIQGVVAWLGPVFVQALANLQISWANAWAVISQTFMTVVGGVTPILTSLAQWIGRDLPSTITFLATTWNLAWLTIGGIVDTILPIILGFVSGVVGAFTASWPQILGIVGTVFYTVRTTIDTVVGILKPIISGFVSGAVGVFQTVWPQILSTVRTVVNAVQDVVFAVLGTVQTFMGTHGAEIRAFIATAWQAIQGIVQTALAIIQGTVAPALSAIAGFIREHGAQIQTVLNGAWTLIKTVITTALGMIQGVLSAVLAAVRGDWSGAWTAMKGVAATLWEGIKGVISGALTMILGLVGTNLGQVKEFFVSKFNEVKTFLGGIDLGSIGSAMIQGLIAGIRSMAGALVAAAKGVVQSAVDAAKALLGIHSPSTVFFDMGEQTDEGYVGGINRKKQAVVTAAGEMVLAAVAKATEAVREFNVAGESAIAQMAQGMTTAAPMLTDAATGAMQAATGVVAGALGLLNGLATEVRIPNVGEAIDRISRFLTTLVGNLGQWTETVSGEAQAQAKTFAEAAGPVVGVYTSTLELLTAFANETRVPGVGEGINRVSRFLVTLVDNLAQWTATVSGEAQAQAKEFSQAAGPVVGVFEDTLGLLGDFSEETRVPGVGEGINRVSQFLVTLVGNLAEWAKTVTWEAVAQAQSFSTAAADVVAVFGSALESLAEAADMDIPSLVETATKAGFDWVLALAAGMQVGAESLAEQLRTLAAMFQDSVRLLTGSAYTAGRGWITSLAEGIRSGLTELQAVLQAVADMFPHSPAKIGPLRAMPDWQAWMLGGFDQAAGRVAEALNTLALPTAASGANNTGAGQTINVNFGGPITIREEADIRRLAEAVGQVFAGQASVYQRLNTTWVSG